MTAQSNNGSRSARCSCKSKGTASAAVSLAEMEDRDRALIRAVRLWAASGGDSVSVGVLFSADTGRMASDDVMQPLSALLDSMDDAEGPTIALREPSCGRTTPSERAIVRMVSAMENGDAATAQACATALVSPQRARRVMADAFLLASALSAELARPSTAAAAHAMSRPADSALC